MSDVIVTANTLVGLANHIIKWIANLRRAKIARKEESRAALRQAILVVRRTQAYIYRIDITNPRDPDIESNLSQNWTTLSFKLSDIGLTDLSTRCYFEGACWADQASFRQAEISRLGTKLSIIEERIQSILNELDA